MKAEDLINNCLLSNIEVNDDQTVVFTEIALTAINMARMEGKQSPWISVNEQLPDNDDDLYIVLDTKLKPHRCGVCEFNLDINKWVSSGGIIVNPTHWMPIPELSKE